ncbi:MAG: S41 family peptidase [Candidatus Omnitrophota bacterium]|nr:S41 family peptidase [Candidatus Omnitrophota bacterium]
MRRLKTAFFVVAVMLTASLTMGGYETSKEAGSQSKEDLYNQIELFSDAISVIRSEYVEEVDSKKMIYGALTGMLSSLDDYSQFMDPDEYKELASEAKGEFGGIGVEITLKDGILTIITPMAGTPAEAAGIKPGDKIVKIDGKTTENMTLNDSVKIMRGEPGSRVTLTVWREKDEKILDVSIKRANIKIDSIKDAYLIDGKIGYIRLVEFQEHCARELEAALKKLENAGMDSLILDLRNNPGGLLESAIDVSEKFIPKDKIIVSTKSRSPSQNAVYRSAGILAHREYPLVVLVNEGSASASEIVAAAIQDNKRGVVLGAKTFGKGFVQTVIPLKDNSALKLTTASYLTPCGTSINKQGIIPDVVVEQEDLEEQKESSSDIFEKLGNNKEAKKKDALTGSKQAGKRDNQLQRAIDLMKAIKVYGGCK